MKKFDVKSIVVGLMIGVIGASVVFTIEKTKLNTKVAAVPVVEEKKSETITNAEGATISSGEGIKSVSITKDKIYFNGNEINLKDPLISIVKEKDSEAELYMPMSELLEYMNFKVEWNSKDNFVNLTMNGQNYPKNIEVTSDISKNQADAEAIEIIQKTGNWGYIETYLPHMSADGIEKAVEIYNSKHMNSSEHKKASDYIKN
ncbi:hypothetical protein [Clostridium weizhouense]|uniref:Copper amine oxidase-like N-terminal domain-containing protein n=1 Tax=Clostridium weizhouense TaxID=2859781 RepID=A0ABS7APS0_9CLOT|nr:hypothetical protein [Clostridium weizhouense]MBW6410660.1 hypothetical protein [Clostridium weizhouense]